MTLTARATVLLLALLLLPLSPPGVQAQEGRTAERVALLQDRQPELFDLLRTLHQTRGVLFGELAREGDAVREEGSGMPTFDFEFALFDRLAFMVESGGGGEGPNPDAEAGYAVLGARAAEVIDRTHDFYLEVLAIYLDDALADPDQALNEAVDRYLSRPEVALPAIPKDMDILYDHPYTWAFKSGYLDLIGFVWASHWLQLAALEPVMDLDDPARVAAGIDTVTTRFHRKLSYGEPPDAFPTELPLAPSIVPGLVAKNRRAGAILDNLNMMQDVLADILVSPDVEDVRATLDEAVEQFLSPSWRVVPENEWIVMALRHSIFNQGGPALGIMTRTERNADGHAQHLQGGPNVTFPGMPGE